MSVLVEWKSILEIFYLVYFFFFFFFLRQLPPAESQGKLQLNVLHRNLFGMDEFLGHVSIPLEQFQVYERPRAR